MSMETLGGHETHHAQLGKRLFEAAENLLTAQCGRRHVASTGRAMNLPLPEVLGSVFEAQYNLSAQNTYLQVSDHSFGISFELISDRILPFEEHPCFFATNLDFSGKLETDTGLVVREYEGRDFKPVPVDYMDENYRKIQGIAEVFIPQLGYEFGA